MKKYIMEIMHEQNNLPSGKYKTIVTVDEAGNYHQYNETENINGEMVRFTEYKNSIFLLLKRLLKVIKMVFSVKLCFYFS